MPTSKPRWTPQQAVFAGEETLKLLDTHGSDLAPRLTGGVVDQLTADVPALAGALSTRPAFAQEAKAATRTERELAKDARLLAARLRDQIKHTAPAGAPVLKAAGVGARTAAAKTSSVVASVESIIKAAQDHPDEFRAARILDTDVKECQVIHDALLAADRAQQQALISKKELTRQQAALQLRVEDAVIAVSLAGAIQFRKDAALVARFEDLVPKVSRKVQKPVPVTPGGGKEE